MSNYREIEGPQFDIVIQEIAENSLFTDVVTKAAV